ncbi:hypothetical protein BLD44_012305 [Mastigocladus laminosus UU774]|nr:hypothetical protein BLD44_012305 [Mastigocladus laminosus UU774]
MYQTCHGTSLHDQNYEGIGGDAIAKQKSLSQSQGLRFHPLSERCDRKVNIDGDEDNSIA